MEQSIMTKLLEGQDKINDKLQTISERTVRVEQTVQRHDTEIFPNITNALFRMESKQNEDMTRFMIEKEQIYKRLTPLESDLQIRIENSKETSKRWKNIFWAGVEKILYVIAGGTVVYWNLIKAKLNL